jgi:hypothetical protein
LLVFGQLLRLKVDLRLLELGISMRLWRLRIGRHLLRLGVCLRLGDRRLICIDWRGLNELLGGGHGSSSLGRGLFVSNGNGRRRWLSAPLKKYEATDENEGD